MFKNYLHVCSLEGFPTIFLLELHFEGRKWLFVELSAGLGGEAVTGRGGILVLADLRQRAIKH